MPIAIAATRYVETYELLHAGFAIPVALAFGIAAIRLARRAREHDGRMLGRAGGVFVARLGRILGVAGICIALTGLISLGVYALLEYASTR